MSFRDRAIVAALAASIIGSALFIVSYATGGDRLYEGLSLALAVAGLCGATLGWAFWILPPEQVVDLRDDYPSPPVVRRAESAEVREAFEEFNRKRALVRMLYAALGIFGIALVVPIRSLGPRVDDVLFHTKWRRGNRLVREDGRPVRLTELNVDSVVTVFPEDALGDAQSQAMLIRLPDGVANSAQGYIAYSKICTHAGCPVALYRAGSKQLMCPCHQSVFDVVDNGAVVAGPADHALPRLPIAVDGEGYLRATGDFPEPVGPGFWERG